MAVWGVGIMLAPILGPTVGGWIADNWSWRWIFYINLPIGVLGFFMVSAFLFDAPFQRKPPARRRARHRADGAGIRLPPARPRPGRAAGLVRLQPASSRLSVLAVFALVGFVLRELMAEEPILDLTVFKRPQLRHGHDRHLPDRPRLQLEHAARRALHAEACWATTPGRRGSRWRRRPRHHDRAHDLRPPRLAHGPAPDAGLGCCSRRWRSTHDARHATMDFWNLAWPRFVQGFAMGFIFLPLQALALATIRDGATGQRHGGLQCRPQHRRQHRRGAGDHAPGATEPGPSGHADRPPHPGAPRADRLQAMDRSLREPWRRHVHRRQARDRHAVPGQPVQAQCWPMRRLLAAAHVSSRCWC